MHLPDFDFGNNPHANAGFLNTTAFITLSWIIKKSAELYNFDMGRFDEVLVYSAHVLQPLCLVMALILGFNTIFGPFKKKKSDS